MQYLHLPHMSYYLSSHRDIDLQHYHYVIRPQCHPACMLTGFSQCHTYMSRWRGRPVVVWHNSFMPVSGKGRMSKSLGANSHVANQ